jgi:hypothetical protein
VTNRPIRRPSSKAKRKEVVERGYESSNDGLGREIEVFMEERTQRGEVMMTY